MKKYTNKLYFLLLSIVTCFMLPINVRANTSEITIKAEPSTVVNLNYHVISEKELEPNTVFILKDKETNEILRKVTMDEFDELFFSNVPFGEYIVTPLSDEWYGDLYVDANQSNYLDFQHIIKDYEIFKDDMDKVQIDSGNGKIEFLTDDKNDTEDTQTSLKTNANGKWLALFASLVGIVFINRKMRKVDEK